MEEIREEKRPFFAQWNQKISKFYEDAVRNVEGQRDADIARYAESLCSDEPVVPTPRNTRWGSALWEPVRDPVKRWITETREARESKDEWDPLRDELANAPPRTRLQADIFDQRRFALQKHAHWKLDTMAQTNQLSEKRAGIGARTRQYEDPDRLAAFRHLHVEVRRNRFVQNESIEKAVVEEVVKRKERKQEAVVADKQGTWCLEESMYKLRPKWTDSGSFFDSISHYDKAFSTDWSRALRTHKLAQFIVKCDDGDSDDGEEDADGDGIADTEIVEVGEMLWQHHLLLYFMFDCFASMDAKHGISTVTYNAFKLLVQDCSLDVPGSKYCDSAHYDQLFIMINSQPAPPRAGKESKFQITEETVGRRGMYTDQAGENVGKRSLCRHQWFNVIVRMAIMRYVLTKECSDVSQAVDKLILEDLVPNIDDWIQADHRQFRREVCYSQDVDTVLASHKETIVNIFYHFADTEGSLSGQMAKEKKKMSLVEWSNMLRKFGLFDAHFTQRDATVVFVLSRMRTIDEQGEGVALKLENLSLEDYYEALTRISVMKALPTDAEVADAGAADVGEFILELQEIPSDFLAWVDDWNAEHSAPIIKATQPAHRALNGLIVLMVRTVESTLERLEQGSTQKGGNLQVSKKELTKWAPHEQ